MRHVRIYTTAVRNLRAVVIESEFLYVVVLPELGAKIWSIVYKPAGMDFLWHQPHLQPRALSGFANFDDNFFGGWDEIFPNDEPEIIRATNMPDHGELWTLSWNHEVNGDTLHLWTDTPLSQCRWDKWISILPDGMTMQVRYRMTNQGSHELPFLWKFHVAMAVSHEDSLDMDALQVVIQDFGKHRTGKAGTRYDWPYADHHDMRVIPPSTAQLAEYQFATSMKAGWCAITHMQDRVGFGLAWDLNVFPVCGTFASYGGWRNLNTVVLEPSTRYPQRVEQAALQGTHRFLQPGQTIETVVLGECFVEKPSWHSFNWDSPEE